MIWCDKTKAKLNFSATLHTLVHTQIHSYTLSENDRSLYRPNLKMFLVGLTGGVGTGKSTVSSMFRELGVPVVDADLIARQIVEPGRPAWHKIKVTR